MKGIVGLDLDVANNYVYWTDVREEVIKRARLDKYDSTELLIKDLHTPDGLAVDWIGKKIYWTDTGLKKIEVAELDGSHNMEFLDIVDHGQPRAIACDPNGGYLYWSDWGRKPAIERISMDGDKTTRQELINTNIVWPNGLTLDYAENKMYWIDSKLKRLEVANMDGTNRVLLAHSGINFPFAIVSFEDYIYWTDWKTNGIRKAEKFSKPLNIQQVSHGHMAPMGIKALHSAVQPAGTNPCGTNNGGCTHLCLIAPKKSSRFSCKCPRGMYLQADQKTCTGTPITRAPRATVTTPTRSTTRAPSTKPTGRPTDNKTVRPSDKIPSTSSTPKPNTKKSTQGNDIPDGKGTDHPNVIPNRLKSNKDKGDSTSSSVGLVIGITLSLLVMILGVAAGVWYYRSKRQGRHHIMYYKDMSTTPLEEDFDGDDDHRQGAEKSKIDFEPI
eukprot:gene12923-14255_t